MTSEAEDKRNVLLRGIAVDPETIRRVAEQDGNTPPSDGEPAPAPDTVSTEKEPNNDSK